MSLISKQVNNFFVYSWLEFIILTVFNKDYIINKKNK